MTIDRDIDMALIEFRQLREGETISRSIEVALNEDGITDLIVHLDEENKLVEIEVFAPSRLLPT
jgi:macrodomain Ter protein organizer (MatP/YcbG family)